MVNEAVWAAPDTLARPCLRDSVIVQADGDTLLFLCPAEGTTRPGVAGADLTSLPYERCRRPLVSFE